MIFSARGRLGGAVPLSENLGLLMPRFFVVDYFASNYFYVIHSWIPSVNLLSRSNVVVSYVKDSHYATVLCGVV